MVRVLVSVFVSSFSVRQKISIVSEPIKLKLVREIDYIRYSHINTPKKIMNIAFTIKTQTRIIDATIRMDLEK